MAVKLDKLLRDDEEIGRNGNMVLLKDAKITVNETYMELQSFKDNGNKINAYT